jgi:hypothetical protein
MLSAAKHLASFPALQTAKINCEDPSAAEKHGRLRMTHEAEW